MLIAEGAARRSGFASVREVEIEIGALSGVNAEALRFALEIVRKSTLIADAEIVMHMPQLLLRCQDCEAEYMAEPEDMHCPVCQETRFEVLHGTEMLVRSISGDT